MFKISIKKIVIVFIIWLVIFIPLLIWLNNNKEEFTFDANNIVKLENGSVIYRIYTDDCGIEKGIIDITDSGCAYAPPITEREPPLAYYFYSWQKKYGLIIGLFGILCLAFFGIRLWRNLE